MIEQADREAERGAESGARSVGKRGLRRRDCAVEVDPARFAPHAGFRDAMVHSGMDIVYVVSGETVLIYDGVEYTRSCGKLGVWPGSHPHSFRNDGDTPAAFFAVATEPVWR